MYLDTPGEEQYSDGGLEAVPVAFQKITGFIHILSELSPISILDSYYCLFQGVEFRFHPLSWRNTAQSGDL